MLQILSSVIGAFAFFAVLKGIEVAAGWNFPWYLWVGGGMLGSMIAQASIPD